MDNKEKSNDTENKTVLQNKYNARKKLKDLAKENGYDKNKYTLREFIEFKRKSDNKLEYLIKEAELDEKSAASLNDLLDKKEQKNQEKENKKSIIEENDKNIGDDKEKKKIKENDTNNKIEEKSEFDNNQNKENNNTKPVNSEDKDNKAPKNCPEQNKEEKKDEKSQENKENKDINNNIQEKKVEEKNLIDPDAPITKFAGEDQKPLKGLVICITGVPIIPKKHLRTLCKRMGAEITLTICKKTQILIYGYRIEDGRKYYDGRLYKAAEKAKIQLYSDKDFEKFIQDKLGDKTWTLRDQLPIIKFKGKYNLKQIERIRKSNMKRFAVLDEERFTGVIKKQKKKGRKKQPKKAKKESESESSSSDDSDSGSGSD